MQYVCDLHIHSKYSRAVSQAMTLPEMEKWAIKKGISLLSAADFTHPIWFRELKAQLVEDKEGVYKLKGSSSSVSFILSTEISSIYSQGGRTRRVHNLIFMPSLSAVEKFNSELLKRGANLSADGRPIIGLSSRNLLELVLSTDPNAFLIPCHAWTPWFSLYGSNSGFDSIQECFQDLSENIHGVETGLSSDPEMNWRIKELENRSILSFSDAHSAIKMGREATIFELEDLTFTNLKKAIMREGANKILYTVEFYPEEGKYHYTGHRNCKVIQTPEETEKNGSICPVCQRPLTVGVMHRVGKLANNPSNFKTTVDEAGVTWVEDNLKIHPPFVRLVPLIEIVSESVSTAPGSLKALNLYNELVLKFGSEFNVLLKTSITDIEKAFGEKVSHAILKVRNQDIKVSPGYDGEYGIVKIWDETEKVVSSLTEEKKKESQMGLF